MFPSPATGGTCASVVSEAIPRQVECVQRRVGFERLRDLQRTGRQCHTHEVVPAYPSRHASMYAGEYTHARIDMG
jgi:hypothetical protein